jgi:hypothetical protein
VFGELRLVDQLWSQVKIVRGAANQLFLLVSGMKEFEAILKALAIPDFSFQLEWFRIMVQVQLKFYNFANRNFTRNGGAEAAFSNVLGPTVLRFFCSYDQAQI